LANEFDLDDLLVWGFMEEDLIGIDYENPILTEEEQTIRQREMFRILISVPIDSAIDVKETMESLEGIEGIEIDYGAN